MKSDSTHEPKTTPAGEVGEAMGHSDIRTTALYGRKECEGMASPLDRVVIPFRKTA